MQQTERPLDKIYNVLLEYKANTDNTSPIFEFLNYEAGEYIEFKFKNDNDCWRIDYDHSYNDKELDCKIYNRYYVARHAYTRLVFDDIKYYRPYNISMSEIDYLNELVFFKNNCIIGFIDYIKYEDYMNSSSNLYSKENKVATQHTMAYHTVIDYVKRLMSSMLISAGCLLDFSMGKDIKLCLEESNNAPNISDVTNYRLFDVIEFLNLGIKMDNIRYIIFSYNPIINQKHYEVKTTCYIKNNVRTGFVTIIDTETNELIYENMRFSF